MEILADVPQKKTYHQMFGGPDIPMLVVWVTFIIPGEEITKMQFSHRDDDPEGMWLADFRTSGGYVHFSHGEGDRTCRKQIAGPQIVEAIERQM